VEAQHKTEEEKQQNAEGLDEQRIDNSSGQVVTDASHPKAEVEVQSGVEVEERDRKLQASIEALRKFEEDLCLTAGDDNLQKTKEAEIDNSQRVEDDVKLDAVPVAQVTTPIRRRLSGKQSPARLSEEQSPAQ